MHYALYGPAFTKSCKILNHSIRLRYTVEGSDVEVITNETLLGSLVLKMRMQLRCCIPKSVKGKRRHLIFA